MKSATAVYDPLFSDVVSRTPWTDEVPSPSSGCSVQPICPSWRPTGIAQLSIGQGHPPVLLLMGLPDIRSAGRGRICSMGTLEAVLDATIDELR